MHGNVLKSEDAELASESVPLGYDCEKGKIGLYFLIFFLFVTLSSVFLFWLLEKLGDLFVSFFLFFLSLISDRCTIPIGIPNTQ